MLKKIIKITIPVILIGIVLLIAYDTYKKTQHTNNNPINIIPTNASVILQLNDIKNLSKLLKQNNIWKKLQNIKEIEIIATQEKELNKFFTTHTTFFNSNSLFISFHKVSAKKSATLFSTTFKKEYITKNEEIINLFGDDITISEYDNKIIYFSKSWNKYFSIRKEILFFSNNKMLIEDAIRTSPENNLFINPLFTNCYKTINQSADINLIVNYNNLITLSHVFTNITSNLSHFSEWTATDVKLKNNAIIASGLSFLNGSINNFTDILNNQKAHNIDIINIIPENTTQLLAISFKDQEEIYNKKNEILRIQHDFRSWDKNRKIIEDSSNVHYNEFIQEIDNEAGIFNTSSSLHSDNTYTYFNTKESIRATSLLQGMILSSSNYKGFIIHKIIDNNFTANIFGDLFNTNTPFFTTIDDYFIFANSKISLQYIIDNYNAKNTLSNSKSFRRINSYISKEANLFFYLNPGKTAKTLQKSLILPNSFSHDPDSIAKFTALSFQINTTKKGRLLHNFCLFYDDEYKKSIEEKWYYPLDTQSVISPQFVENHNTKEKMILIQDKYNTVIALNSDGDTKWTRKIESKILGDINSIVNYKDQHIVKFQALFNTKNKLYLIDRLGRMVESFPIKLPQTTSIGHSLYIRNNNYRTIITGDDNQLYNINEKWKETTGWKYKKTNTIITQKPIHFVINNNDYILKATNNSSTTKLLDVRGRERKEFKGNINFANKIKISKEGTLYGITTNNKIWTANVDGSTTLLEINNIDTNTQILAYNEGYYIGNNNSLSYINYENIQESNITLDSQIQTISLLEGYITIKTDKSLYLIKENKIIDGFPIDSDGLFNISDIDYNGKKNLININNNLLYNYELKN